MVKDLGDHRPTYAPTAREALEASEARFRNIIERNGDGILVVQPDGMIRYVNPAATRLLQRSADQLVGSPFGIPIIPGETTEVDLPLSEGGVRVAEMRVDESEWEGERALLASLRDISDRKRLEEQLRQKLVELAQADQRKDEFLAMLAHELRNPLAPILNAVHIMRLRREDPLELARMREVVEQQVQCMARLVDDLLDVSRITRGKIQLRYEPVSLATIVQRSIETVRPLLQAKEHDLRLGLPEQPIRLWADPLRLEQILNNLLTNAAKYTDKGGTIEVLVEIEAEEVAIRIKENGIGIAPTMLGEIFQLFSQVDRSLDRSQGGLGIGLTLARNLVHLHQGTLTAHSDGLGRGSEFVIRLPNLASFIAEEATPPTSQASPVGRISRVLVVDDNVPSADSLCLIMKLWGHECRVAHTGPAAIEEVDLFKPDIVMLDIGLPGMDGYVVAQELRKRPELKGTLLIAMTGYGREEDRIRSRAAGFDHHLVKPLDLDALEVLLVRFGNEKDSVAPESSFGAG